MNIGAMLIYLIVQTFTPGPSNFMSLYTATTLGFRAARGYRLGTMTGFAVKLVLCGFLNIVLASVLPGLVPYLKWVGAAYLTYLAVHIVVIGRKQQKQPNGQEEGKALVTTFWGGIMVQVFNIKSWLMAITLFSVYVVPYTVEIKDILLWSGVAIVLMGTFTWLWAFVGNAIKQAYTRRRLAFDLVFAALLLYSAVSVLL